MIELGYHFANAYLKSKQVADCLWKSWDLFDPYLNGFFNKFLSSAFPKKTNKK